MTIKKSQNIGLANIKCGKFYNCSSNTYNNEMYLCNKYNLNLYTLCKLKHDNNPILINYNLKNYALFILLKKLINKYYLSKLSKNYYIYNGDK